MALKHPARPAATSQRISVPPLFTMEAEHLPRDRLPEGQLAADVAYQIVHDFNTFRAMQTGLEDPEYDRPVWTPDAVGSALFLASGYLAFVAVCAGLGCWRRRSLDWWVAAVNLLGCAAFGIAAIASYVVPDTGSVVDLAAANSATAFGGLCFLVGAVLLLPASARS